ncbi:hypothetical protein [Paenibacillus cremeus]|uniref:Uncharacterized protein n=1 Tax=Paenibacillus cremeus TaxID=2163881 RepID=A0A559KCT9_9BACL|nr:hypothetical protein [Paenibacillus cremeus]TVY09934.1 hypothetical protein FPZ49_11220 [Paenibacillus cremeus]
MTIKLNYALDKNVFASDESFKLAVTQVKSKQITVDELQSDITTQILSFYSAIYNHFNGSNLIQDDILYRDSIHSFIESNYNNPQYWTFFSILKNNGLIGVCARGYTFDYKPVAEPVQEETTEPTNEQTNTYYTAYNRSFPTYAEAEAYCISSDFDPSFIVSSEPITTISGQCTLYNKTYPTYTEAYQYAIMNQVKTFMIHHEKSPITNDRLHELEWQYITAKHSMSLNDALAFLSHLNTLPLSLDIEQRINHLNFIIKHRNESEQRKKQKEQLQSFMYNQINSMIEEMQQKGLERVAISYGIKYTYNNDVLISFIGSGITIEKMYDNVLTVYNEYFKSA